jgi:murein L,D-transpeptidase YcbB/YkuD
MRSLKFVAVILCSALLSIIVVSRRAISASESRPQQSQGTLTPAGVTALHTIVDMARNDDLRWPDFAPYKAEFGKFYVANGDSLVWVPNGQVRPQALAVIEVLKNANSRGLDPEDYDGPRWPARILKLQQSPSEQDLVSFDTALTVSAMRYVRAVHVGRANPKQFNFQFDNGESQFGLADFLQSKVANATDPAAEIEKLEPPFPGYRKLLALLPV